MTQQQIPYNGEQARANRGPDSSHDKAVTYIAESRTRMVASSKYIYTTNPQSQALNVQKRQAAAWESRYSTLASDINRNNGLSNAAMNTPTEGPVNVGFEQQIDAAREALNSLHANIPENTSNV